MTTPDIRILVAIVALWHATDAIADVPAEAWRDAAHPLEITAGGLAGPGADWMMQRAANSQFVLFGEPHGVTQVPQLVSAAMRRLRPSGFRYLAVEMGPWTAERLSIDGVDAVVRSAPHAIAFDHDPELELLREAIDGFEGSGRPVWGLDQASTAVHPFERLISLAPDASAARLARGAHLKAALKFGEYLRQPHAGDLDLLREAFDPTPGSEVDRILSALAVSQQIFVDHRAERYAESVSARENYMIQRLHEELRSHQDSEPIRVIFKFGGAHIMEGIGPNGVRTLGDEAQRIARSNGLDALHVGLWRWRADDPAPPDSLFETESGSTPFALVDVRALRASVDERTLATLPPELRAAVAQYDAIVFIRDPEAAAKDEIRAAQQAYRDRLLAGLSPLIVGLFGGLLAVVPLLVEGWRRVRSRARESGGGPVWPWLLALGASAGGWTLVALQVLRIRSPLPGAASLDAPALVRLGVPLLLAALGVWLVITLGLALRNRWWGPLSRLALSVAVLLLLVGLSSVWWWNLGAMLP